MKKVFSTILAAAFVASMSAAVNTHFDLELGYDNSNRFLNTDIVGKEKGKVHFTNMNGGHVGGTVLMDFVGENEKSLPGLSIGLNYQFLTANGFGGIDGQSFKKAQQEWRAENYDEGFTQDLVYKDVLRVHSLQLPIRFRYTYQFDGGCRIYAFTGPQLRVHIAEKYTHEETYNEKILKDPKNEEYEYKKNGSLKIVDYISGNRTYTEWEDGKEVDAKLLEEENKSLKKDEREPMFDVAWGFGLGFGWKWISLDISYDLGMLNMQSKKNKLKYSDMGKKYILNDNVLAVTLGFRLK